MRQRSFVVRSTCRFLQTETVKTHDNEVSSKKTRDRGCKFAEMQSTSKNATPTDRDLECSSVCRRKRTLCMAACFTAAAFFGGIILFPFFGAAAARAACRAEGAFCWRPFVLPWAMGELKVWCQRPKGVVNKNQDKKNHHRQAKEKLITK